MTIRRTHTKAKEKQRARRAATSPNTPNLHDNTAPPSIPPVPPPVYQEFVASREARYYIQDVPTQKRRAAASIGTMKGLAKALNAVLDADDSDLGDYGSDSPEDDLSSGVEGDQLERERRRVRQGVRQEPPLPAFTQGNEGTSNLSIAEHHQDGFCTHRQGAREDTYESLAIDTNDATDSQTPKKGHELHSRYHRDQREQDSDEKHGQQEITGTRVTNSLDARPIIMHSHGPVDTLVDLTISLPTESVSGVSAKNFQIENLEPPVQIKSSTDILSLDNASAPEEQKPTESHSRTMGTLSNDPKPKHYASSVFSESSTLSGDTAVSASQAVSTSSLSDAPPMSRMSIRRKPVQSTKSQDTFLPASRISMQGAALPGVLPVSELTASLTSSNKSISNPLANHFAQSRHPSWSPRSMSDTYPVQSVASSVRSPDLSPQPPSLALKKPDHDVSPFLIKGASDGSEGIGLIPVNAEADAEAAANFPEQNALIEASAHGNESNVELILTHECALDQTDSNRMSSLHYAATRGHLSIARKLLAKGATVDIEGPDGQNPLHLALRVPHVEVVMLLLQRQANVNARDVSQRTPLHISSLGGNVGMCTQLLDHGAQLESRDSSSKTALQFAVEAQHIEVVRLLLDRSRYKPKDSNFLNAFFAAVETGNTGIAEIFLTKGLSFKVLKDDAHKPATLAAKSGNLAMLDLMIRNKCRLKEKDSNGWTALHFAAHQGHTPIVERLLGNDISSKAVTSKKETPLHLSVKAGCFATTDILLRGKNAAQATSKDKDGQEPLHHAARGGNADIFSLLVSQNAKIDARNPFGWAPIHIATAYGHIKIVEQCLERGVSIEEKLGTSSINKSQTHTTVESGYWAEARWPYPGSRPLHLSLEYGRDDMTRFLVEKGATTDATCSEGWTPIHYAAFYGSAASVELLLEKHAYPHATTDQGRTPLQLAVLRSQVGTPMVPEQQSAKVQQLLSEAMLQIGLRRRPVLKQMLSFKGKAVEDKIESLKTVATAMDLVARKPTLSRQGTQQSAQSLP